MNNSTSIIKEPPRQKRGQEKWNIRFWKIDIQNTVIVETLGRALHVWPSAKSVKSLCILPNKSPAVPISTIQKALTCARERKNIAEKTKPYRDGGKWTSYHWCETFIVWGLFDLNVRRPEPRTTVFTEWKITDLFG